MTIFNRFKRWRMRGLLRQFRSASLHLPFDYNRCSKAKERLDRYWTRLTREDIWLVPMLEEILAVKDIWSHYLCIRLPDLGQQAFDVLIELLGSANPLIRANASRCLGAFPKAEPQLILRLADPDYDVRWGAKKALKYIIEHDESDGSRVAKRQMALAIGFLQHESEDVISDAFVGMQCDQCWHYFWVDDSMPANTPSHMRDILDSVCKKMKSEYDGYIKAMNDMGEAYGRERTT